MKNFVIGFFTCILLNTFCSYNIFYMKENKLNLFNFQHQYLNGHYFLLPISGACVNNGGVNGHGHKIKNWADYFGCDKFQKLINIKGKY